MRIITWNINGVRTLPQYHPWNTLKSMESILNHLGADIACLQEMKTTRQALNSSIALPPSYDAFFSLPAAKGGYSGVAVYTKIATAIPLKAEEGLSGSMPPPRNISPASGSFTLDEDSIYPSAASMELFPSLDETSQDLQYPASLAHLDLEGRALVLDFGLFVLINLYCPNETSDARFPYKMNFHLMLEERVRILVEEQHREVIVIGDINICAAPDDHCEGYLQLERGSMKIGGGKGDKTGEPRNIDSGDGDAGDDGYISRFVNEKWKGRGFWRHPAREWLRRWLNDDSGVLVDVLRKQWPDRKGMYTCWNTKIGARATNYGTRIDYILVTKGLLPWVKAADIMPDVKGSDHCPVWMDLFDEIETTTSEGVKKTIAIKDAMRMREKACNQEPSPRLREPPSLASKWWDEFSGKQTLLSSFFGSRSSSKANHGSAQGAPAAAAAAPATDTESITVYNDTVFAPLLKSRSSFSSAKRKFPPPTVEGVKPAKRVKPCVQKAPSEALSQAKLHSFFGKQKSRYSDAEVATVPGSEVNQESSGDHKSAEQAQEASDYQLALFLSQSSSQSSGEPSGTAKRAWSALLAPLEPPKCLVHGEPTSELTVNKSGPNKGKKFFICSRPVGPGYDKGRSERLREDVDPRWRCNYFKWSSEVRRDGDRALKLKAK